MLDSDIVSAVGGGAAGLLGHLAARALGRFAPAGAAPPPDPGAAAFPWVDAVRALVRPALTFGLAAVLAAAVFVLPASDPARVGIADGLVFVTVTAIVWWFGDRAPKKLT